MSKFTQWLNTELNQRGWSRSEAARRGGISASMFDKVINGRANPGLEFCKGVARAFEMPLEDVLRLASILPPLDDSPETEQLLRHISHIADEDKAVLLHIAQLMFECNTDETTHDVDESLDDSNSTHRS